MRSLFVKLFVCMLFAPILARSTGLLLYNEFGDSRPEAERALGVALPLYAETIATDVADGRQAVAEARLADVARAAGPGVSFSLIPPVAGSCRGVGSPNAEPRLTFSTAVPVFPPLCLTGTIPPRPRILGFLPASIWTLLPLFELLTCGIISFLLARYLTRPLGRIRVAATAFASGDLSARAGPYLGRRRDEAADLVREFDRMADRVAASMEAQQRFIGDVSHEIKSPLARLSMALGLARRESGDAANSRFDRMERELDTISRLVRELLMLSSLQGSVAPNQSEPVDLAAVVQEAANDLAFQWRHRAHEIAIMHRGEKVWVAGDAALLRRVTENVLANALFYTPDGTTVEVIVDGTQDRLARIMVRDYGPGVPPSALPRLFEPFYRVDEARARNTGGVGLGLAICKRGVELHGGHIAAQNAQPGLAVTIDLPSLPKRVEPDRGRALGPIRHEIADPVIEPTLDCNIGGAFRR